MKTSGPSMLQKIAGSVDSPIFRKVIQRIVSLTNPMEIYLISCCEQTRNTSSIFSDAVSSSAAGCCCHLLIIGRESAAETVSLQDHVEQIREQGVKLSVIWIPISRFTELIRNHDRFALKCIRQGQAWLQDDSSHTRSWKDLRDSPEQNLADPLLTRKQFKRYLRIATEFMAGADLYLLRQNPSLASFHLHQVAEQILSGVVFFQMGWQIRAHNLDRLLRHALFLMPELQEIFPRNTDREEQLFQLLKNAYTGPRYDAGYLVSLSEVVTLRQRIAELLGIVHRLAELPAQRPAFS